MYTYRLLILILSASCLGLGHESWCATSSRGSTKTISYPEQAFAVTSISRCLRYAPTNSAGSMTKMPVQYFLSQGLPSVSSTGVLRVTRPTVRLTAQRSYSPPVPHICHGYDRLQLECEILSVSIGKSWKHSNLARKYTGMCSIGIIDPTLGTLLQASNLIALFYLNREGSRDTWLIRHLSFSSDTYHYGLRRIRCVKRGRYGL